MVIRILACDVRLPWYVDPGFDLFRVVDRLFWYVMWRDCVPELWPFQPSCLRV